MRWIFVDRFLEIEKGKSAKAIKNVSMGEDHIHDHFPSFPVMPNIRFCFRIPAPTASSSMHTF